MTRRKLGVGVLGFSLAIALVYVPACEYNGGGGGDSTSGRKAPAVNEQLASPAPAAGGVAV